MSYRTMSPVETPKTRQKSARERVAAILAEEILDNPSEEAFAIESEHQLCQRFNISRVTVRLALGDLQNRGLIYKRHGRGTFAHGTIGRVHRHILVLNKGHKSSESSPLKPFLEGLKLVLKPLRAGIMMTDHSPEQWGTKLPNALAGVLVLPDEVSASEIANLKDRSLPFLLFGNSELKGPRIVLSQNEAYNPDYPSSILTQLGQYAAEAINRSAMTGELVTDIYPPPYPFSFGLELIPT